MRPLSPLNPVTARNLWALRWNATEEVHEGEVVYWCVPDPVLSARIGSGYWTALRRRGHAAWLLRGGEEGELVARTEPHVQSLDQARA